MLIPLEERRCGEGLAAVSEASCDRSIPADDELAVLRQALRDCRKRLHRGALESTRRIARLTGDVSRLEALNTVYCQRIERLESGVTLMEMARKLMALSEDNESLRKTAQRAWLLEKRLVDAHAEYASVADERDQMLLELAQLRAQPRAQSHRL